MDWGSLRELRIAMNPTELTWIQVVFAVGLPAAFGGLLQGFHAANQRMVTNNGPLPVDWGAITISALFGIGGGAAAILGLLWIAQLELDSSDKNVLILITLGVVAGFIGNRLLPLVAETLERRIAAMETGTENAVKKAEMAAERARESAKEASKALLVSRAIYAERKSQFRELVPEFRELIQKEPLNRAHALRLANLYKRAGEFENAEGVLTDYLNRKGTEEGHDLAESLYIRACYRVLQSNGPAGEQKKQDGLKDLERVFKIDSSYKLDAAEDKDFKILRSENDPTYARIIG